MWRKLIHNLPNQPFNTVQKTVGCRLSFDIVKDLTLIPLIIKYSWHAKYSNISKLNTCIIIFFAGFKQGLDQLQTKRPEPQMTIMPSKTMLLLYWFLLCFFYQDNPGRRQWGWKDITAGPVWPRKVPDWIVCCNCRDRIHGEIVIFNNALVHVTRRV